ncbi:hypothetical protein EGR_11208 [Echinococcus granulosus]|uniref:Uncharacterized protein n=1 Tax=Echinococcus granulosus TaxID=6210 RepID=W6TYT9_ECHGR|nr:hypothetical protein EGR_11208 [Echinococcus granulosus]EUB53935.1 hypothetical protein EGR_11208 [Echinococcus granulosus]
MTSKFTLTTRAYDICWARHALSGRQLAVVVNLTGACVIVVQKDFEKRVHVDMIDATSKVAIFDLATLSREELSTNSREQYLIEFEPGLLYCYWEDQMLERTQGDEGGRA